MPDPVDHETAHSPHPTEPAEPPGSRLPAPTLGRGLAALQLAELAAISAGGLEIITESTEAGSPFVVSLATDGIAPGPGVRLRSRERFRIYVGDKFPFTPPKVFADHQRWAGSPHVQWGTFLCLYAAESVEWNSADGMRGFVERLLAWLESAAAGTLDPDDRPLHPPSTTTSPTAGRLVVRPDLGDRVPWAKESSGPAGTPSATQATPEVAYGWCVHDGTRLEVLEWLTLLESYDKVLEDGLVPLDERGRRYVVVPVVMMDTHLGWEYPQHAADLAGKLEQAGYSTRDLLDVVVFASRMNRLMRMIERDAALGTKDNFGTGTDEPDTGTAGTAADTDTEFDVDRDPLILGLATPSRRVGSDRLAHIVAWKFTGIGVDAVRLLREIGRLKEPPPELVERLHAFAQDWIDNANVAWVRVHEMRPEVTRRRDEGSPGQWLAGKNVVLLGAGAIGAVVAEQCVRLGCENLVVVDDGVIGPGILVRQPYYDRDVGQAKAEALASRLNTIVHDDVVTAVTEDCRDLFLDGQSSSGKPFWLSMDSCDLVIDATANAGTRAVLERVRASRRSSWPPVVTMLVGHQATRGLAIIAGAGASSSSHELLRRVAVRGRDVARPQWGDIVDDFFPDPPRTEIFFPEPGCSEPTFTGSASDVTSLASTMFGYATAVLAEFGDATGAVSPAASDRTLSTVGRLPRMRAAGFRLARPRTSVAGHGAVEEMSWHDDVVQLDPASGFEVRITAEALVEMRTEVRRGARARGPGVETGGIMLGFFDEASRSVIVDLATGPAPDSLLSEGYFFHGVDGTQDDLDRVARRTGKLTRFVGIWHCHPYGRAWPSPTDEAGITVLTSFTTGGRRALMVILGSSAREWEAWRDGPEQGSSLSGRGSTMPGVFARVVERPAGSPRGGGQQPIPLGGESGTGMGVDPHAGLSPYQRMLQMPPIGVYYAGGFSDGSSRIDLHDPSVGFRCSDEPHDLEQ